MNDTKLRGLFMPNSKSTSISVELTTARTMAGIAKTEVRHNDLPHAREALNQARRAYEVAFVKRSEHPLNDNESALHDSQFRGSRGHTLMLESPDEPR